MINNPKGFAADGHAAEHQLSSHFNSEVHHDIDPNLMYYPPLDLFSNLSDDLHQNPLLQGSLLPHLQQDLKKKGIQTTQNDFQALLATQLQTRNSLLGFRSDQELPDATQLNGGVASKEEDSDSDDKSNSSNKRGKYRTYTDDEKNYIIAFMGKQGMQKTLEIFSGGEHKITKRKLKSWMENQNKVKGVKGRKSTDPVRDEVLYKWCMEFQNEHDRPPSRKETTAKALELSGDPSFQASKGWLDKFSKKFNIEFTPLKIIPPRGRKKIKLSESDAVSATSTFETVLAENPMPLKHLKSKKSGLEVEKNNSTAMSEESIPDSAGAQNKMASLFNNLNVKQQHQKPKQLIPQQLQQQQRSQQPDQQSQMFNPLTATMPNTDGVPAIDPSFYSAFPGMDGNKAPTYPYPFLYPMDFSNSMQYNFNGQGQVPARKPFPLNYPMNPMNMNLPLNLGFDNFQRIQQMIKKDDMHLEKNNS